MFRGYTAEEYKVFVDSIRALDRPISITTDIIVGFCDETEEDFKQSLEMIRYANFDMIYIGIYSPRPGTYGAKKYEDNIPQEVKKDRRARMNEVLIASSKANNEAEIGKVRTMMIKSIESKKIIGYTDNMKNVTAQAGSDDHGLSIGDFAEVKITNIKPFTVYGEVVTG